ncbi:MAG: ribonuclease T2 [Pseudomonadota bacterium]
MWRVLALVAILAVPARGDETGSFDYYVLALSWSPGWCAREGDARGAAQCGAGAGLGFTLHGLWPQHEAGWPEFCATEARDPSGRETAAMADIMGSGGLAWHQWRKHGRCSGLSARQYFALSRAAYGGVVRPEVLRALPRALDVPPRVIEAAFLEVNPGLSADGVTVTCRAGALAEVRICLTRGLEPRACAPDVRRDCPASEVVVDPLR